MSMAVAGLLAGMALGFAGYFGGFGAFLLVAALGAVGFIGGRFLDGDLHAGDVFRPRDREERGDRHDRGDRRR
ncbi:hypothetical protein OHU17_27035 [Streptomyces goshikiensis]|uniref:DUF2273 domain-containing protein n=1 Tax=Streptomyces goshikiensis TaxID=1942 RepID=A0ABZ1RRS7_9ACTN|nr:MULTISPECIES: hypothetical protein [Streptomyces]AKL65605.1 hypothetical protein M444_09580 [Streptomyces sp. Mg1]EDX26235.1 hypothetical protein SSAG_06051 [Streptomyces sp. Mg1]MBP0933669.1 hypothetical protein [Streptomyces sp. KCTC 0041BP]OKI27321.1 hypothetical protein A6A28_13895 [Streptomyces sp. CB03578]OKI49939.1 hypothetical protein AMK15_33050 [Streptomyces sp. MJM1172]